MIKKLKLILLLVLVIPISIVFSACSCSGKGNNPGGDTGTEEPVVPVKPEVETYSVSVDYNLPEKFNFLYENVTETKNVGEDYVLPSISNELNEYFVSWCYLSNDEPVEGNVVTGKKGETISIYASWNETNFVRYFEIGELEYSVNEENLTASVVGFSDEFDTIVIPQVYRVDDKNYSVNSISANCFENSNIKEIVTYTPSLNIESGAFKNSQLESIDFSIINNIGEEAFSGTKISQAVFAQTLESVGKRAFLNCLNLELVDFSKVQNIISVLPESIFDGCTKLESVELNSNFITIDNYAFRGCTSLEDTSFLNYSNLTTLGDNVFENCTALEEVIVYENITNLGNLMFEGCDNLKTISISNIIYELPTEDNFSKFYGNLSETVETIIVIGDSITSLPSYYFANYTALKTFVMSNSISVVNDYAFAGCINLENITFSNSIDPMQFNISTLQDTKWYNSQTEIVILNNVIIMAPATLSGNLVIPDGVTAIISGVFSGKDIESVTIPASLEIISNNVFFNCSSLEEVVFNENSNLTTIGAYAFNYCSNLSSINLEVCENLTTIGNYAFSGVGNITLFTIPENVSSLGTGVFSNSNINSFAVNENNLNFATDDSGVLFEINSNNEKVSLLAYPKTLENAIYYIPETVTRIMPRSFMGCSSSLEYIYVTSQIAIASDAFLNAGVMPNNIKVIAKTDESVSVAGSNSNIEIYQLLHDTEYTFEYVESEFVFEFSLDTISSSGMYYIEFEHESTKYAYLLRLANTSDKIEITKIEDISEIIYNV